MNLYLRYSKIIKETEKAYIIQLDLTNINKLKKDLIFTTESEEVLSISEIPKNFKISVCIPISISSLYSEFKIIMIQDWFYSKNLHNLVIKIGKTNNFTTFGKICPLWLRRTMPKPLTITNNDNKTPLFSETYSEIDLRDNSHLF